MRHIRFCCQRVFCVFFFKGSLALHCFFILEFQNNNLQDQPSGEQYVEEK